MVGSSMGRQGGDGVVPWGDFSKCTCCTSGWFSRDSSKFWASLKEEAIPSNDLGSRRLRLEVALGYTLKVVAHTAPHSRVPKSLMEGPSCERTADKGRPEEFYRR